MKRARLRAADAGRRDHPPTTSDTVDAECASCSPMRPRRATPATTATPCPAREFFSRTTPAARDEGARLRAGGWRRARWDLYAVDAARPVARTWTPESIDLISRKARYPNERAERELGGRRCCRLRGDGRTEEWSRAERIIRSCKAPGGPGPELLGQSGDRVAVRRSSPKWPGRVAHPRALARSKRGGARDS